MSEARRLVSVGTCEVCAIVTLVNEDGECPGCAPPVADNPAPTETCGELYDRLPLGAWVDLPQFGVKVKAWERDLKCRESTCPDFGSPDFGEGTCPAEHADPSGGRS